MDFWTGLLASLPQLGGTVGLTSTPWVFALMSNRIITRGQHLDRVSDLKATITRLESERDYERQAKEVERERADATSAALGKIAETLGKTTVHLLESLPEGAPHG